MKTLTDKFHKLFFIFLKEKMQNYCTLEQYFHSDKTHEKYAKNVCPITGKDTTVVGIDVRFDPYHIPIRVCSQDCAKKVKHLHTVFTQSK